jgi:hypothetical protein
MKPRTRIIYFMCLNLTIGALCVLSLYIKSRISSIWPPLTTSAWIVVLVVASLCCLGGAITLLRQMGKLWELAETKIGFFAGMSLVFLGAIWVLISIRTLFN